LLNIKIKSLYFFKRPQFSAKKSFFRPGPPKSGGRIGRSFAAGGWNRIEKKAGTSFRTNCRRFPRTGFQKSLFSGRIVLAAAQKNAGGSRQPENQAPAARPERPLRPLKGPA
jgi:hypothetical protein